LDPNPDETDAGDHQQHWPDSGRCGPDHG
jgi:hypothetical protein